MADAKLKTYQVLRPILHDGERYTAGETIDLTDAAAAPLLRAGMGLGSVEQLKKRTGAIAPIVAESAPKAAAKK
jgi:hypothetical protein